MIYLYKYDVSLSVGDMFLLFYYCLTPATKVAEGQTDIAFPVAVAFTMSSFPD